CAKEGDLLWLRRGYFDVW
nr:immunoglobulin heavy chain junction region [Mus musculus]